MLQIWNYEPATGPRCYGVMKGFTDFGGTDVTYRFHRLGPDGLPIVYENGGICLDLVSGPRLKAARRVGAVKPGEAFIPADAA